MLLTGSNDPVGHAVSQYTSQCPRPEPDGGEITAVLGQGDGIRDRIHHLQLGRGAGSDATEERGGTRGLLTTGKG